MRFILRLILVLLVATLVVLVAAGCHVLYYQTAPPVYPPSRSAATAAMARTIAVGIAAQPTVDRSDLAFDLAPSTTASMQLYVEGRNFFPAMLADIRAAHSSVHFEEYGFTPGEVADMFVPELAAKVQQGVEVRMVVDRFGSHVDTDSKAMFDTLVAAGVHVGVNYPFVRSQVGLLGSEQTTDWSFQQLGHFYHRKMFVIDGQIGWIGGAGIEDPFYDGSFQDVMVRVTGDAVAQMQLMFLADYRFHGGPLPGGPDGLNPYFPTPVESGSIPTTFVNNVPGEDHRAVTDAIWDLVEHARTRLDVVDPYVADSGTLLRLMAAAQRGVRVRFIVPADSNSPPVQWALEHHLQALEDAGVAVYLHPVLPHEKVVVADDRVLVGSTNLDSWALFRNWETSLVFDSAEVATSFEEQLFEPDLANSTLAVPPAGLQAVRAGLAFLFSPVL